MAASSHKATVDRPRSAPYVNDNKELEKYAKHLFYKTAQVVVQSRQGGRAFTESQPSPVNQSWFCLAINDNGEITHESRKAIGSRGVLGQSFCIEISLKTIEGDSMVLETWVLSWGDASDPTVQLNNTIYNHMGLLLKSVVCVTRATPAYRLARKQGPETFVICYRIYSGVPNTSRLGDGFQSATVGQVVTGVGTLQLRVDYRTQMTIAPNCSSSGQQCLTANWNNPAFGGLSGVQQQQVTGGGSGGRTLPVFCKSDYFLNDANDNRGNHPAHQVTPKSRRTGFVSESEQQTSDESQEALKIFAASPDPTSPQMKRYLQQMRQPTYTSSNESLSSGQHRFYRPRSGTNQSLGSNAANENQDDGSGPGSGVDLKLGAFVSRPVSAAAMENARNSAAGEGDDPLLLFFNLDISDPASNEQESLTTAGGDGDTSPAKAERVPDGVAAQELSAVTKTKKEDFVLLNFKTPFSAKTADNACTDLGIFFKDVQSTIESGGLSPNVESAPALPPKSVPNSNLKSQLSSLDEQLSSFESNLLDFDDMLKTMEVAATSESESEVSKEDFIQRPK